MASRCVTTIQSCVQVCFTRRMLTLPTKIRQVYTFRDYVARMVVGVRRRQWDVQERVATTALWINSIRRLSEKIRQFFFYSLLNIFNNTNKVLLSLKSNLERSKTVKSQLSLTRLDQNFLSFVKLNFPITGDIGRGYRPLASRRGTAGCPRCIYIT